jgi:hypothetical protein
MRFLITALLWAAPLLASAEPLMDLCERQLPAAHIRVRASFAEPEISFALGAREIEPLAGATHPGVSLGLTQVETRVEQRVSLSTLRTNGDPRVCARPQIELTLMLHRARIHVARELVGNECAVAAVWHHELRHFGIYQETLIAAASDVERLMLNYYDGVVLVGTEDEVLAQIERDLRERWAREIDALTARGNIEQELLDARDAQYDETLCDGALQRLADRLARDAANH